MALGILLAVAAAAFIVWRKVPHEAQPPNPAGATSTAVPVAPDLQKLLGRWLRPDGGYLIDITDVQSTGKMQAGYFNPNPIHVARAEAALAGETMTIFIELQDLGYPGSTYTLSYDPQSDQLRGVYYQAAMQQSFEVIFVRTN